MSQYHVAVRKPVMTPFMDTEVYSNPSPSVGGTLIIFLLRLLQENNNENIEISHLVRAMAITNQARKDICTDPNQEYQINELLDGNVFAKYLKQLEYKILKYGDKNKLSDRGETTHVSVIDKDLNAASLTTTNGEGCGYIVPGSGIMLNNMLGEDDLNPFGFLK